MIACFEGSRSSAGSAARALIVGVLSAALLGAPRDLRAQQASPADPPKPSGPPVLGATRVQEPPALDGEVLQDPAWAAAAPSDGFWQITPNEGEPASERTEVRVVYTSDTLYFGVVCYDRDPASIIVSDSRRDSSLDDTDSFRLVLDTYLDQQNGFVFGTNPSGLEYDGQVINEGDGSGFPGGGAGGAGGGRQQGGSGRGFNLNWDGSWQVRTKVTEAGWSAELAIPFRTLRYPSGSSQIWGLNFQRNIRRRNETAFWAPLPRQFSLYRLSLAGTLTGLEVPAQRNLKLTPYALGQARRRDVDRGDTTLLGDVGVDLKYSLTPSLTLDATYNTDFAQVEVDEQQINLDRFNLFFPEKRPFFLENAGLFAVGNPGSTEVFFSRRIGIGPDGVAVPILGGARLSGNLRGMSVGLLNMQTDEIEGVTPANNFTVARIRRDLANRSNVGAIFVNRQATGELAGENAYNRAYAFDARAGVGVNGSLSGFAAWTDTPGIEGDEYTYDLGWQYNSQKWRLNANYTEVADHFNPEVGFLNRRGYRHANSLIFRTFRLGPTRKLHEIRPHVNFRSFWNFSGFQETGFMHIDSHWEWKNGAEVHTGMNLTEEGVTTSFVIFPGITVPPGTYKHREAQIMSFTNQGAPLSFRMTLTAGGFFGGDRIALSPSVRWRAGETFNTDLSLSRNDIDLPWGSFVTNLIRARVSYSFSPRITLQGLIQYNDRADLWSTNLRFSWLTQANTGLFIVYNDTRGIGDLAPAAAGRSFIVKFSRLFDLLD